MKRNNWKTYAFWLLLTEAVGGAAALLTRRGMEAYKDLAHKPPLTPPAVVFPIAWSILYALMGVGAARIDLQDHSDQRRALTLYWVQLAANFLWSILFFGAQAYGAAFFWLLLLWGLILAMILAFRPIERTAALLQIPYLLWVAFAGYLNGGVWLLNR